MPGKETIDQMFQLTREAKDRAYAPYSKFKVGVALLGKNGKIYTGCNVENASHGLSVCAERAAVFKAVSDGEQAFDTIAILSDTENPITPCGACRQVLAEFNPNLKVVMVTTSGKQKSRSLSELLPDAFQISKP